MARQLGDSSESKPKFDAKKAQRQLLAKRKALRGELKLKGRCPICGSRQNPAGNCPHCMDTGTPRT